LCGCDWFEDGKSHHSRLRMGARLIVKGDYGANIFVVCLSSTHILCVYNASPSLTH